MPRGLITGTPSSHAASQICQLIPTRTFILLQKRILVPLGGLLLLVLAAVLLLTAEGLRRYGSVEGVVQRMKAEFAAPAPHDLFVPTPAGSAERGETPSDADTVMAAAALAQALAAPTVEPSPAATLVGTDAVSALKARDVRPDSSPTATDEPSPQAGPVVVESDPKTAPPAATPRPTPSSAPTPRVDPTPRPPTLQLDGLAHYWQTWNNCGPATLSMNLSYFGIGVGQDKIGGQLRPEKDDKNVTPEELAAFARSQGLSATVRVNGDAARLRALLEAGIPVLVETWYEPEPNDGMGHYRLIVGYDDAAQEWIAYDSYDSHGIKKDDAYCGIRLSYATFDPLWKVFGRTYLVITDASRAPAVAEVLGSDADDEAMWRGSLARNLAEVKANPGDPFAWFNLGTDYTALGDFEAAAQAYDTARRIKLPWRMLWYQFGPFRAYYEVGRLQEVIYLADATIKTAQHDEELFYWKGLAQWAMGDGESARASLLAALALRPAYAEAADALAAIE